MKTRTEVAAMSRDELEVWAMSLERHQAEVTHWLDTHVCDRIDLAAELSKRLVQMAEQTRRQFGGKR